MFSLYKHIDSNEELEVLVALGYGIVKCLEWFKFVHITHRSAVQIKENASTVL